MCRVNAPQGPIAFRARPSPGLWRGFVPGSSPGCVRTGSGLSCRPRPVQCSLHSRICTGFVLTIATGVRRCTILSADFCWGSQITRCYFRGVPFILKRIDTFNVPVCPSTADAFLTLTSSSVHVLSEEVPERFFVLMGLIVSVSADVVGCLLVKKEKKDRRKTR